MRLKEDIASVNATLERLYSSARRSVSSSINSGVNSVGGSSNERRQSGAEHAYGGAEEEAAEGDAAEGEASEGEAAENDRNQRRDDRDEDEEESYNGPPTLEELRELSERLEQRCRLEDIFSKQSN